VPKNKSRVLVSIILLGAGCYFGNGSFAASSIEGIQIYQNEHLSPAHKQKLAEDLSRYRHADNVWDVLRDEFSLPHYEDNPAVLEKIDWFMNNQDFLLHSMTRAAPYLYYILQQVKKRHLPAELVLLPIIESGYNPFSLSNKGAAGIWQLMPDTASGYGIRQDGWYDGRRDVIVSTRAALNYLAYLQNFFEGNWLYAIAAYNTGEGNLLSAIKRNIRDGRDTDFWSLPVAQQTKDFVPSLLALAVIISHPEKYPFHFPAVRNAPYLAQIDVGEEMSLKYAAALAGLDYTTMTTLNPGFNRHTATTTPASTKLVLPIENVVQFTENLSASTFNHPLHLAHYKNSPRGMPSIETAFISTRKTKNINSSITSVSPQSYTLQPGDTVYMVRADDTLESIAARFHINVQSLQAVNRINNRKLPIGKELIVPTHLASNHDSIQPGDTIYMVRHGDTIEKIADKFHTTAAAIRLTNLVDDNSLVEGEKLVVPTHFSG